MVDGHTSTKTGLNHSEIVNLINQMGVSNIKNAFMLDGGGTTRAYTKSDNGTETVMGSFVDNRFASQFLYLSKMRLNQNSLLIEVAIKLLKMNHKQLHMPTGKQRMIRV